MAGRRIIGFISFPRVWVLCEIQTVLSRSWIKFARYFSYDPNYYTTGISIYIYIYVCVCVCVSLSLYIYIYIHKRKREGTSIYIYVCMHMSVCVYIYIYIYTHKWKREGTHGVIVNIIRNGYSKSSSNYGQGWFTLGKGTVAIIFCPVLGK